MAETAAERLEKAQRKQRKAARRVAKARRDANLAAGALPHSPGTPSLPVPTGVDDALLSKSMAGDAGAREILRKRGTDILYAQQLRHMLVTATYPGAKAWAAGALAALDESFDPLDVLPRGGDR
jgi:hypothetical protein